MAKKNTKAKPIQPKGPLEWIYELDDEKTMRNIYESLRDQTEYTVEYWEDAAVIEIALEEGGIDLEQSEEKDIFWVTLSQKGYDQAMAAMKEIEAVCGGKFSVDE